MGPGGRDLVQFGPRNAQGQARGYALFHRRGRAPLVFLGGETPASFPPVFSGDGRLLAWSNPDGTVSICDLPDLHQWLSEAGLGW
jgi:hypothetical protein